jgi:hypothetical protein
LAAAPVLLPLTPDFLTLGVEQAKVNGLCLLSELVPTATRVAVLVNPTKPGSAEPTMKDVQAAADGIGMQIQILNATTIREIDAAYAGLVRERPPLFSSPLTASSTAGAFNLRCWRYATPCLRHIQCANMPKLAG